jgi:multisubunit Na+/H+ antiporter MnhC subunit
MLGVNEIFFASLLSIMVFSMLAFAHPSQMIVTMIFFSPGVIYSYFCIASPSAGVFPSQKSKINFFISPSLDVDWDASTVTIVGT